MSFGGGTITNPANVSFDIRWPKKGTTTLFTGNESLTKVWGSHQIKAGFFGERDRMFKGFRGANNGSFDFSRDVNNPFDANYAYATAILGYFRTYTESSSRPGPDMRSTILESYLQDSWRVNRKLTLDYGLRLGAYTPLWTPNLKASSFDPSSFKTSQAPLLFQPRCQTASRKVPQTHMLDSRHRRIATKPKQTAYPSGEMQAARQAVRLSNVRPLST